MSQKLSKDNLTSSAEWQRFAGQLDERKKDYFNYMVEESNITIERVYFIRGYITAMTETLDLPNTLFND